MRQSRSFNGGFTYMAVLCFVAIMSVVMATTGVLWSSAQRREKERELLFVGHEFRKAIANYYQRTPGSVKRFPMKLSDLLRDERQLATVRHLRRIYADPLTAKAEWGVVRAPDGGIMGVYSLSTESPIKRQGFLHRDLAFEGGNAYAAWRFVYQPPSSPPADGTGGGGLPGKPN